MSFQSVKTLCKVGAVAALGALCFKVKNSLSQNSDAAATKAHQGEKALLIVQNISHAPWIKFTAYNQTDNKNEQKVILGTNIHGHNVSMLTAAHLLTMKRHAADSGFGFRVAGELLVEMNSFVKLVPESEQAKLWLDKNGPSYGFIPAVDVHNQPIAGMYHFNPLSTNDLSTEILSIRDTYSQLLITTTSGLEAPRISKQAYSQNSAELLAQGIFPKDIDKDVSLQFNFSKYSDVISELIDLDAKSIKLVPVKGTIYGTLEMYYPGIKTRTDFSKILDSVVRLNSALLDIDPLKINKNATIALPVIAHNPSPEKANNTHKPSDKKQNTSSKIRVLDTEFTAKEIAECRKIAAHYKIIGKEHKPGIITHRMESSLEGTTAIANIKGDPGAASYGRCQLSGVKGSLTNFVNFCLESKQFASIGKDLEAGGGLKGKALPGSFDSVWLKTYKKDPTLFTLAESKFIEQTIEKPSLERGARHGLNTKNIAIKAFLYSLAAQFGTPDPKSSPSESNHKFDEICRAGRLSNSSEVDSLESLIKKRTQVLQRMADYQEQNGNLDTALVFRSIAKNRYMEEAKLFRWLHLRQEQ